MRYFLLLCLVAALGGLGLRPATAAPRPLPKLARLPGAAAPRSVVIILTDDHRADFMGFTGKLP